MSKEVELIIEIDKQGNVVVTPKGTQGKECLDLMKFCQDNNFYPSHNEFEVMKDCYLLGSLDSYMDTVKESQLITIIQ